MHAGWWLGWLVGCGAGAGVDRPTSDTQELDTGVVACGNGVVEPGEGCDEGEDNATHGSSCTQACEPVVLTMAAKSAPVITLADVDLAPERLAVADLNHDGAPDIAMTSSVDRLQTAVSHALNDGTGTLVTPQLDIELLFQLMAGAMPDLDQDGRHDLVLSRQFSTETRTYLGSRQGLTAASTSETGKDCVQSGASVTELDGNGIPDAIMACASGHVVLAVGDGLGSLAQAAILDAPDKVGTLGPVVMADVSGDGLDDIVRLSMSNQLSAVWQRKAATAADLTLFASAPEVGKGIPLAENPGAFDVDGDGDEEIVAQGNGDGLLYIVDWSGVRLDRISTLLLTDGQRPCVPPPAHAVAPVQVDLDGTAPSDLLLSCGREVAMLRTNPADGGLDFEYLPCPACLASTDPLVGLVPYDVDNDGNPDITGLRSNGEVLVWWGDGSPTITDPPDVWHLEPTREPTVWGSLHIGDIHGDGLNDLVVTTSDGLAVVSGVGPRRFLDPSIRADQFGVLTTTPMDLDADGRTDLAWIRTSPFGMCSRKPLSTAEIVVSQNPRGRTDLHVQPAGVEDQAGGGILGIRPSGLTSGPLDDNAFDDLVVVSDAEDRYLLWLSDGEGSFVFSSALPTASAVHAGRGDATFGFPAFFRSGGKGAAPSDLVAADIDDDGMVDLVVLHQGTGDVVVHLGTGPLDWGRQGGGRSRGAGTGAARRQCPGDGGDRCGVGAGSSRSDGGGRCLDRGPRGAGGR